MYELPRTLILLSMARRSSELVSRIMRRVKSSGTRPEVDLRRALWASGLRYRLKVRAHVPGKPDLLFPGRRVVVFVDGDFWHGKQWIDRGFESVEEQFRGISNESYWTAKIRRNMERDARVTCSLRDLGWTVVRCWESEIRQSVSDCVQRVADAISLRDDR